MTESKGWESTEVKIFFHLFYVRLNWKSTDKKSIAYMWKDLFKTYFKFDFWQTTVWFFFSCLVLQS